MQSNSARASAPTNSSRSIDQLVDHIYKHWGLVIDSRRRSMLDTRLQRRMREHGFENLEEYATFLFNKGGLESEQPFVINSVTTQTTSFYREDEQFDFLENTLIEDLYASGDLPRRRMKFWSAASSIGAEAYTIGMVADQAGKKRGRGFDFSILATDISEAAVRRTEQAVYREEEANGVPAAIKEKYFLRSKDRKARQIRIVPELREKVQAEQLNLTAPPYSHPRDFDAIFIRNCLIYFDRDTQLTVAKRLVSHLRPGGYLLTGHSEQFSEEELDVVAVKPSIYRRER